MRSRATALGGAPAGRLGLWGILLLTSAGCSLGADRVPEARAERQAPNVLVFLADDVGVDKVGVYGAPGDRRPATPRIDALAAEGVRFTRAYVHPICSPTRAALLTGQAAWRTGIGRALGPGDEDGLSTAVPTLPALLGEDYATAAVGKWHLSLHDRPGLHPQAVGFDHYAGPLANLHDFAPDDGIEQGYADWLKIRDGERERTTVYVTFDNIRESLRALRHLEPPWLLYVAFTAPHGPFHTPPRALRYDDAPGAWDTPRQYDAMVESVDVAVGRILDAVAPEVREQTYVVFLGDNGTPPAGVRPPFDPERAKGSPFEGGLRVPWIVTGPGVAPGRVSDALVADVDLLPTVLELAGRPVPDAAASRLDGVSFAGHLLDPDTPAVRRVVTVERFQPVGLHATYDNHLRIALDATHKVIRADHTGREGLYRLGPWDDGDNLLAGGERGLDAEGLAALRRLRAVLDDEGGPLGTMSGAWAAQHPHAVSDPARLPALRADPAD